MTGIAKLRTQLQQMRRQYEGSIRVPELSEWPELETPEVLSWLAGEDVEPLTGYVNAVTGRAYKPHHLAEWEWLVDNDKRNLLARGGEGSGKTSLGAIRALERIKVGASGTAVAPSLPHLRLSLWPVFRAWIPWAWVIEDQRYRSSAHWEPQRPFILSFLTGSQVYFSGAVESDPEALEGSNLSFAWFDECRRHRSPAILKVLSGRVRIPAEPYIPSLWLTSTPRMGWMHEYFGEIQDNDERRSFKENALDLVMVTADNLENLSGDYVETRAEVLTSDEEQVYLRGAWLDIANNQAFVPNRTLWDLNEEQLPPLTEKGTMVIALDAAIGRKSGMSDCFGILGVTAHPTREGAYAVRFIRAWRASPGHQIQFDSEDGPLQTIRQLCEDHQPVCFAYDPSRIEFVIQNLNRENIAWFWEFSQQSLRAKADKFLLDLIVQKRIAHPGDPELTAHVLNANRKVAADGQNIRIIKRSDDLVVDLAVCLSMACYKHSKLNIETSSSGSGVTIPNAPAHRQMFIDAGAVELE